MVDLNNIYFGTFHWNCRSYKQQTYYVIQHKNKIRLSYFFCLRFMKIVNHLLYNSNVKYDNYTNPKGNFELNGKTLVFGDLTQFS